jgi:hypothetical protein
MYKYVEVRLHMFGDSRCEMLTLIGGLYSVGFINCICVLVAGVLRQRLAISVGPN